MTPLYPFTVIYVEPNLYLWNYLNCHAENSDRAQELCEKRFPDGDVIWVNMGHNNTTMDEPEGAMLDAACI